MVRTPPLLGLALIACTLILLPTYLVLRPSIDTYEQHSALWAQGGVQRGGAVGANAVLLKEVNQQVKMGGVIMPKLGNATAK